MVILRGKNMYIVSKQMKRLNEQYLLTSHPSKLRKYLSFFAGKTVEGTKCPNTPLVEVHIDTAFLQEISQPLIILKGTYSSIHQFYLYVIILEKYLYICTWDAYKDVLFETGKY